jgi:hypothetical protein
LIKSSPKLIITSLVLLALMACDSDLEPGPLPSSSPTTSVSPTLPIRSELRLTPIALPPTVEANVEVTILPSWTPDKHDAIPRPGVVHLPRSGRVQVGQAYIFHIYTHCGVDQRVDFDGSFWDAAKPEFRLFGNAPPGVGDPGQAGIMTLLDSGHARFEVVPTDSPLASPGLKFDFVRHDGPKHIRVCY